MSASPTSLIARDLDTGVIIANRVSIADTRITRAVGLLSRDHLSPGEALWIMPCRGVHTWGMRFTIDVVALDAEGTVVDVVPALKPWRIRLPRRHSVSVLELPQGTLQVSRTIVGHRIALEPCFE
jgi:uncharacterized membrane protein (UPF0127 family)